MFPRERRIQSGKDILQVLRRGRRASFDFGNCYFFAKPGTLNRVGVIVDTKVSKLATVRNRCKRRVRAILAGEPLPVGDLIIRLKPGAPELEYETLKKQIQQCLQRVR